MVDGALAQAVKIVFLNDLVYDHATGASSATGGAERQQWLLARALAAIGWRVTVGVRNGLLEERRVVIDGVEFVGIGQRQILWAWYRFLVLERPDWWYWRCASHLLGPAVAIGKLAGVRIIFAAAFDRDLQPRRALYRRPRMWPLYLWGLAWTDRIFVQHEGQFLELPSRWRSKARVIPSMATEEVSTRPQGERAKYVAWVAVLREFKRPDLLVEIARKAPAIRFVVCGGTTTFMSSPRYGERIVDALRALPNIEYRGQVPPDRARQVIAEAALFISTADEEGFPNTFLQAWAAGTPVVSIGIDPGHVIERQGLGVIAPNIESAVSAIHRLMHAPHQREAIASRGRRYVAENHGQIAVTRAFENAIATASPRVFRYPRSLSERT